MSRVGWLNLNKGARTIADRATLAAGAAVMLLPSLAMAQDATTTAPAPAPAPAPTLDTGDTSCAANVKPVRLVPNFVQHAADAIPATPSSGNTATTAQLAQISAAVQTAGVVIARWNIK